MSTKRLRWLLAIVVVELLAVIGIMVWAVIKDDAPKTTTTSESATVEGTALAPALFATGLSAPTTIASTNIEGDARLFVGERPGTIQIVDGEGSVGAEPFLNISDRVKDDGGEMGFLGLTFHPKFEQNGFLYVDYIDKDQNTIISRFTATSETKADPASEKVLLKIKQPYANHNGGALQFGPDGFLYIGMGDGGSAGDPENRAQNKDSLLGKILRIDVDTGEPYSVPSSNPFVNQTGAKPEVWAYGLRNPWRISFDRQTGDLFIGDVGQGDYEEVDFQAANSKGGENYGWRCYEGVHEYKTEDCQSADAYVKPILEYDHSGERCSVTGGYVYRGTKHSSLTGKYVYADLCGYLYVAEGQDQTWSNIAELRTPYYTSTFGQDSAGELYFADLNSGSLYMVDTN